MFKRFFLLTLITVIAAVPAGAASAHETAACDVAVIGAGTGGCAAAIQAARMGMTVLVLEPSDWIGGQMTGAAVSTMDDKTFTRTGIYGEFIDKVRENYKLYGRKTNTCYWGSDTIAFEPSVGKNILKRMLDSTGRVKVLYEATPVSAKVSEHTVKSALFSVGGEKLTVIAKVFIDATEYGDFIPMTGARYRAGNSLSTHMDKKGVIQDITYVAVVKKYPNGLPDELKVNTRPPHYEDYLDEFRAVVVRNGNTWPGEYPFDIPSHNAYRALPDTASSFDIDGGRPETWKNITKTCINWANDYPGGERGGKQKSMSVRYLTDRKFRLKTDREAMGKTLAFLYYMQHELGLSDWSVDNGEGYGGTFSNNWEKWSDMPEEFAPVLNCFPPFPYVRESRRIAGVRTMVVKDVLRDPALHRTLKTEPDAVALGEYPIDIHGIRDTKYLDSDLGEKQEDIPNDWQGDGGLFQIPLGALIPEKIDGLLAAEKNISVSRIVNGSIRLQPVTMLTGQAAGALAALAVEKKVQPRGVRALDVQKELLDAKDSLSIYRLSDVRPEAKNWTAVQLAVVRGYLDPLSENTFGLDNDMHWIEVRDAFRRLLGRRDLPEREMLGTVTKGEFAAWLKEVFGADSARYADITESLTKERDSVLKKEGLAEILLAVADRLPNPAAQKDKKAHSAKNQ